MWWTVAITVYRSFKFWQTDPMLWEYGYAITVLARIGYAMLIWATRPMLTRPKQLSMAA